MPGLREALTNVFPADHFLPGLRIAKGPRVFSIRLSGRDDAVALNMDAFKNWPADTRRCDGLFLCAPSGSNQLVVVLVELKGGHAEHALEQIKTTSEVLCKRFRDLLGIHTNENLVQAIHGLAIKDHGRHVLGFIVGKKKLSLKQQETATLRQKHGIRIRFTGKAEGLNCHDLVNR